MRMRRSVLLLALLLVVLSLPGCGSGGSVVKDTAVAATRRQGAATFTIRWPIRPAITSRLIPAAASSISITATPAAGGPAVAQQLVPRPPDGTTTSIVTFANLLPQALVFRATAYPNSDGSGTAQASGSVAVTVLSGQTAQASLTMGSTIASAQVTPNPVTLPPGIVSTLAASAMDASGAVVVTSSSKWTWTSSNPSAVTVTANGDLAVVAQGSAAGTATITATETESGKTAQCVVTAPVSPTDPNYPTYVKIEAGRAAAANIAIDGVDGDWTNIPSFSDPSGDADGDPSRDIVSASFAPTADALYIRVKTLGKPSTADYAFGFDIDLMGFDATDIEVNLVPSTGQHRLWYGNETWETGQTTIPGISYAIKDIVEVKIPYSVLIAALPADMAANLTPSTLRSWLRVFPYTYSAQTQKTVDQGPAIGSYVLQATPYAIDPPQPHPGTSYAAVTVPMSGKWEVAQGSWTYGSHKGIWAYDLTQTGSTGSESQPPYSGNNADYYDWGKPILAPISGTMGLIIMSNPDVTPWQPAPNEGANSVEIGVDASHYLLLLHCQQNSALVATGQSVSVGTPLALTGDTVPGGLSRPHVHLDIVGNGGLSETYPIAFRNVRVSLNPVDADPWERQVASWDIKEGFYVQNQ